MSEIKYPNFKLIQKLCREKIAKKFFQYGNQWKTNQSKFFWNQRLEDEIKEIRLSTTAQERESEIIDAINILMMMFENNHPLIKEEWEIYAKTWRYG